MDKNESGFGIAQVWLFKQCDNFNEAATGEGALLKFMYEKLIRR
jgi:hypothetical protein